MATRTHYWLCLAALALLIAGCQMERRVVKRSAWDQMFMQSEWYEPSSSGTGEATAADRSNRGYAIELGKYTGAEAFHAAHDIMQSARQEAGLANLWHTTIGRETTVYVGRFREDDSREAETTLRRVREARIDGQTPFEEAKIVKLRGAAGGEVLDPRDLRTLKGKGLYTLQIGYFDSSYGPDFRRAAETAVDVLRDQGEKAYYYHGPHRSMVLVNAWTRGEAFTLQGQVDRYSNTVRAVQEKYPHNVPNGRAFKASDDPEFVASQKSFLVPIR